MISRCHNPKMKDYHGKDIRICEEWYDFHAFQSWMFQQGWTPNGGLWFDRIKNHLGYYPANCRFVTPQRSAINRTITRVVLFKGRYHYLKDVWERYGVVSYAKLVARLKSGWYWEDAMRTPDPRGEDTQWLERHRSAFLFVQP